MTLTIKHYKNIKLSAQTTCNYLNQHFELAYQLKDQLKTLIFGIGQIQKKLVNNQATNITLQTSLSFTFKRDFIKKYILLGEQQLQYVQENFQIHTTFCIKKLQKFQRHLFLLIEDFIQTISDAGQWAIFLSKNLLIKIVNYLEEFIDTKRCAQLSDKRQFFEKQDSSIQKKIFDKSFVQSKGVLTQKLDLFISDFIQLFNYLLKKVKDTLKEIRILKNVLSSNLNDKQMFNQANSIIAKKQKLILVEYLQQKYVEASTQIETCLSCQSKVSVQKMDTHLLVCKSKTEIQQQISNLDGQIIAKIYDLNSQLANAKNCLRQKLKELNEKINTELEKQKISKVGKKQFYGAPILSKTLGNNIDSDSQSSRSVDSPRGVLKNINELTISQISTFISVIEQIQSIGIKIKSQRQAANLALSNELFNMKNIVFHKFKKIYVKSPLVNTLLNLLSSRRQCMRKLSKSLHQAKQSGLKFVEDVVFHNQYQDLADASNKKRKNKKFLTPSQRYFSEEQTPSVSNQAQYNYIGLKDFLILGYLGKGQFGQIFLVKKKKTGVKYAMKKVSMKNIKKNTENIENELVALSVVNSEFVVKTIFSFTQNDYHYFVMEYLPNGDFFQLLENEGRLYESECKCYFAQIATGINDLHKQGIVHRDIKPQNILISQTGHIKISDFGLSQPGVVKKQKQQQKNKRITEFVKLELNNKKILINNGLTKIVGSPYFMSPEVLSGQTATTMSDWWSFGILVYQVLIGWPPFGGQSFDQIVQQVFERKIWPNEIKFGYQNDMISLQAKDLIQKLLTPKPQERLGINFQQIKNHSFFEGVNWNNLSNTSPHFQFQYNEEDFGQGKQMSQKASSKRSTNPDLKLIRKDILLQDTKRTHSKKIKQTMKLKKLIEFLRKQSF